MQRYLSLAESEQQKKNWQAVGTLDYLLMAAENAPEPRLMNTVAPFWHLILQSLHIMAATEQS